MSVSTDDLRDYLIKNPGKTCTEIGEHFWGDSRSLCNRQSWARPAGALVKRAIAEGKVRKREKRERRFTRNGSRFSHCTVYYSTVNYGEKDAT